MRGIKNLTYEQRLHELNLTKLSVRQERGDLIEYFKISNDLSKLAWQNPNKRNDVRGIKGPVGGVRGHLYRITSQLTKINQREHFLPNRVTNSWRELQAEVNAKSTISQLLKPS